MVNILSKIFAFEIFSFHFTFVHWNFLIGQFLWLCMLKRYNNFDFFFYLCITSYCDHMYNHYTTVTVQWTSYIFCLIII